MNDRETVVKALEACGYTDGMIQCDKCPYNGIKCWTRLKKDLLELLKAQEPRVMTVEEALGAEVNVDQCWLEVKGIKALYLADAVVCPEHLERADIQRWGAGNCQMPLDLYGKQWRCWTAKPSDEQREATPWN